MSHSDQTTEVSSAQPAEPLDAFERAWVDVLQRPDADLAASEDAFVRSVLDRAGRVSTAPPVVARIGWAPLAAAAAVAVAGAVAWAVLFSPSNMGDEAALAEQAASAPGLAPQPRLADGANAPVDAPAPMQTPRTEAERRALAQSLELGALIAETSANISRPAASLPKAIGETSDQLTLKSLTQGIANPVPDPAQVLPPRRDQPRG
ncbi:MAG: hypothetical protein ACIAXF_08500 [Phycisphaerales bacterium JB063]